MGYHSTPAGICKGVFYEDFVNSHRGGALGAYAPPAGLRTGAEVVRPWIFAKNFNFFRRRG